MANIGGFSKEEEEWIKQQREREAQRQKRSAGRGEDEDNSVNINSLMDIMVIILVFLLDSYGEDPLRVQDDDLKVPSSASELEPADTLTIAIHRSSILVNDSTVIELQEGEVDPSHFSGDGEMLIDPLLDSVSDAVSDEREQAELTGDDFEPEATVIADQSTRHRLILEVLYTATEAELSQFRFAVIMGTRETFGGFEPAGVES